MFDLRYLNLRPVSWSQEIRCYPRKDGAGDDGATVLTLTCGVDEKCDVLLRNGEKLRDFQIPMTVAEGQLSADDPQRGKFSSNALGGLWFLENEDYVHGWFFLKSKLYNALWDQVRDGRYVDCWISLGVEPISDDEVWKDNPLSIVSASFAFGRRPPTHKPADQQARKKGWFR